MAFSCTQFATVLVVAGASLSTIPSTLHLVQTEGPCDAKFTCLKFLEVPTPRLQHGEVMVRLQASSLNPENIDMWLQHIDYMGIQDVAGTVVACSGCKRLKQGDSVFGLYKGNFAAEYVITPESYLVFAPSTIDIHQAAVMPVVSLTMYYALKESLNDTVVTGSPWPSSDFPNFTIAITAGSGGTGILAIQLAKAWGAKNIITQAGYSNGIEKCRSLGATRVTNYHIQNMFVDLPDDSFDVVLDNYNGAGPRDQAFRAIRPGGAYVVIPNTRCLLNEISEPIQGPPCVSSHPKPGVRHFILVTMMHMLWNEIGDFVPALDEIRYLMDARKLQATIQESFAVDEIAKAASALMGRGAGSVGHPIGKIGIAMNASLVPSIVVF